MKDDRPTAFTNGDIVDMIQRWERIAWVAYAAGLLSGAVLLYCFQKLAAQ